MPPIRAFVAIRTDPRVEQSIARLIDELRPLSSAITWTDPTKLHLTLKFLGARVDRTLVDRLADSIAPLAAAASPFSVIAHGIGAFPDLARPRTIFVGLRSEPLAVLAAQLEEVAVGVGFPPADHPFTPHLTIGRVRSSRAFPSLRAAFESVRDRDFGFSAVGSLTIYQSHLSPRGTRYEPIAKLPLGDSTAP
jgi:2'-5' RNA ligase